MENGKKSEKKVQLKNLSLKKNIKTCKKTIKNYKNALKTMENGKKSEKKSN